MSIIFRALSAALLLLAFPFGSTAQTLIEEQEPNNPCALAQNLGNVELPFAVPGSLDSTPEVPDVDFFRGVGSAGQLLQIDLEGASTGQGTLGDPYLGLFNSACELVAINDDYGSLNSRLYATLPEDGVYILGVTQCCDSAFTAGGFGTYRLTVSAPPVVESIGGRIVDATSFLPLPGDAPPYAWVELVRCQAAGCFESVASAPTGSDGSFLFSNDYWGYPLTAGSYQVNAYAVWYFPASFGPFEVPEGAAYNLGDLGLYQYELIGSIEGRLVDALNGSPLPGNAPPYANVSLERCDDSGCSLYLSGFPVDDQGYFRFEGVVYMIPPGAFRILANADDYYAYTGETFFVGDDETVDLGELGLTPLPIAFGDVVGCETLPLGETCSFSVQVTNRGPGRYRGEAWAIARYFTAAMPNRQNRFQIGRAGAENPNPLRLNLAVDRPATLEFQLDVPATAAPGTYLCVAANLGRDPVPQFDAVGDRQLFCAYTQADGTLSRLSDKESRRRLRELETSVRR